MGLESADFLIVGAGMAGASAGYELAAFGKVIVLEREPQPGYHTTGRSAALYAETYGNFPIRAITSASRGFYVDPPAGFTDHVLLSPRGTIMVGSESQRSQLEHLFEESRKLLPSVRKISAAEALAAVPVLKSDYVIGGVAEPDSMDIDVHALHQGYLKGLRARGGRVVIDADVTGLVHTAAGWTVETRAGAFSAPVVINAAGAWADVIGEQAGAKPIGLVPKRRTAITFDPPTGIDIARWPAVIDADETWYFKPDAGRFLASPADETPSPPCDAQPEELDIAICVDRLETATTLQIRRIAHSWAGLRSFVMDKTPVVGFDDVVPGFFWLAGQGGYGIQTAPAMGRIVAALARGRGLPSDVADRGVSINDLAPSRLR